MTDITSEYSAFAVTAANAIAGAVNREMLIDTLVADLDARLGRVGEVEGLVITRSILERARTAHAADQIITTLGGSQF